MALGYKLRTGGGLEDKVFGIFSTGHEEEETTDETGAAIEASDVREAKAWAKKQNEQAALCGRPFRFAAHVPGTQEEGAALYVKFLAMHKAPGGFLPYK